MGPSNIANMGFITDETALHFDIQNIDNLSLSELRESLVIRDPVKRNLIKMRIKQEINSIINENKINSKEP